jgi:hypothetical protein
MDPDPGGRDDPLTPNAAACDAAKWRRTCLVACALALSVLVPSLGAEPVSGRPGRQVDPMEVVSHDGGPDSTGRRRFASAADSVDWELARERANNAQGFRLVISLFDRRLWAIIGGDTLLNAPVAVASNASLDYQGRRWTFTTPRGRRSIVAKDSLPVWVPPDWHYYEVAREHGLVVKSLVVGRPELLEDGRRLEARSSVVGVVGPDSLFIPLPPGDEIIFDGFLYIPPLGTLNRQISGELGLYRIDLGGGFSLHGTRDLGSIGEAATHGCIRLRDADIAWLYQFARVGLGVYIY